MPTLLRRGVQIGSYDQGENSRLESTAIWWGYCWLMRDTRSVVSVPVEEHARLLKEGESRRQWWGGVKSPTGTEAGSSPETNLASKRKMYGRYKKCIIKEWI